jgi:hypothetical protein
VRTKRVLGKSRTRAAVMLASTAAVIGMSAQPAAAASSKGCVGGGFSVLGLAGGTVSGEEVEKTALPTGNVITVQGRYVRFDIDASTFGVRNWTLTGAPNVLDITGGRPTPVFASKLPDHRGLSLTSAVSVELDEEEIEISRTGTGLSMKIQSKDCAQGGIFQMEPERGDATTTRITHTLAGSATPTGPSEAFYFDNPFFRARIGQVLNGVTVSARVNFANDFSPKFVGRDSPQVATRVSQTGLVSVWDVASGGRMGQVMGEDSVEVAPPATDCVENCQAQNRVRGRFVVLGFPFRVPAASRLPR